MTYVDLVLCISTSGKEKNRSKKCTYLLYCGNRDESVYFIQGRERVNGRDERLYWKVGSENLKERVHRNGCGWSTVQAM